MKEKVLVLAVIVISLSIMAYNTLAYFTAEDTAHNVITSSGVNIAIEEWKKTDDGLVPYPDEPIKVMPAVTVSKIVTVKNKEAESYIRAQFKVIVKDSAGNVMELDESTLKKVITIAQNTEDWMTKENSDGWYYYKDAVETGEATEPLFSEVVFSGVHMTNEFQDCTVEIDVIAQAVQVKNNGATALEAEGWPAIVGEE